MTVFTPKHPETTPLVGQLFAGKYGEELIKKLIEDILTLFAEDGMLRISDLAKMDLAQFHDVIEAKTGPSEDEELPDDPYVSFLQRIASKIWHPIAEPYGDENRLAEFHWDILDKFIPGDDPEANGDWLGDMVLFDEDIVETLNIIGRQWPVSSVNIAVVVESVVDFLLATADGDENSPAQMLTFKAADRVIHWYKIWAGIVQRTYEAYEPIEA